MLSPYWYILIAALIPYLTVGIAKAAPSMDNDNPRDWAASLHGYRRRAYAAHLNSFEAFPVFAAALLTALHTGANTQHIHILAWIFLAARILYTFLYITNKSTLRSIIWALGFGACIGLFVISPL